jgi:hypothetical protein
MELGILEVNNPGREHLIHVFEIKEIEVLVVHLRLLGWRHK